VLWTGTTNTVNQYGRFQVTARGDNSQGVIFRSSAINGTAGPHYEVHAADSEVRWEHVLDDAFVDRPDTCTLASAIPDGSWFGAQITGTGNNTVVEVFVSATELSPDPSGWPLPVCTLTGDPATPVDTGNRVGIRSYTKSQTVATFMDNVCVGDHP
jgi:hypothetical protein